jgi:hypothetical protein
MYYVSIPYFPSVPSQPHPVARHGHGVGMYTYLPYSAGSATPGLNIKEEEQNKNRFLYWQAVILFFGPNTNIFTRRHVADPRVIIHVS